MNAAANAPGTQLAKATAWLAAGRYTNLLLQFGVTVVLARLLEPGDFGLLAMVVTVTGFLNVIAEGGLNAAVVQEKEAGQREISTIFWMAAGVSLLLVAATSMAAPALERFFRVAGLSSVLIAMSTSFVFIGIAAVSTGKARRSLHFRAMAIAEVCAGAVAGAVALILAMRGAGVWALVGQIVAYHALRAALLLALDGWFPSFVFDRATARRASHVSRWITGALLVGYWGGNVDRLLIGRIWGAAPLGFYTQAQRLAQLPTQLIAQIVTPAVQPVLRQVDDPAARARLFARVFEAIALICLPCGVAAFLLARELVLTVWGSAWEPSVPLFRILAPLIVAQPLASMTTPVLLARDRARTMFLLAVLNTIVFIAAVIAGARWGAAGVAAGFTIAYCLMAFPLSVRAALAAVDAPASTLLAASWRPAVAATVTAVALYAMRMLPLTDRWRLGAGVIVTGLAVSAAVIHLRQAANRFRPNL